MEYLNSLISSKHVKTIMDLSYMCCPLALYFKGSMCVGVCVCIHLVI